MPTTIGGYTIRTPDGFYTIVLNAKCSYTKNVETYRHEINHIRNGEFESELSADIIEFYAHKAV